MRIAKTLIRLGGWPGWSESSLGAQVILLVLSCCSSNVKNAFIFPQINTDSNEWKFFADPFYVKNMVTVWHQGTKCINYLFIPMRPFYLYLFVCVFAFVFNSKQWNEINLDSFDHPSICSFFICFCFFVYPYAIFNSWMKKTRIVQSIY